MKNTILMLLCLFIATNSFAIDTARALYPRYVPKKKLILGGQGNKTPQYVRDSISVLSRNGWDGVAMRMNWPSSNIFHTSPVSECDMQIDSLRSVVWNDTLTDNFIRMVAGRTTAPDWFDDGQWTIIMNNMRRLSYALSEAGVKGIFLDAEPFGTTFWTYNSTIYPSASLNDVRAKVKERGKAFIKALQKYKPDIKIILVPFAYTNAAGAYELVPDFANGILEEITGDAKLIDANEWSYYWTSNQQWNYNPNGYTYVSGDIASTSSMPEKAKNYVQVAQATRYGDSYLTDTAANISLQHRIYQGFYFSDEYMWLYGELTNDNILWNSTFPEITRLAIDSAKKKYHNERELGFVIQGGAIYSNDLQIITPQQDDTFNICDTIEFQTATAPGVTNLIYFVSYNRKWQAFQPGQIYKQLAWEPGRHIVHAYSNLWEKLSNHVTFYVRDSSVCPTPAPSPLHSGNEKNTVLEKEYKLLKVYPNPPQDYINFNYAGDKIDRAIVAVVLLDENGNIVRKELQANKKNTVRMKSNDLVPGNYLYMVQLNDGTILSGQFVKL